MRHKKRKKERADTTRASVEKEMAMPRMAGSARIMDSSGYNANSATAKYHYARNRRQNHSVFRSAPAAKGVNCRRPADPRHRDLRIVNILIDSHGDDLKLKRGAQIEVIVTAERKRWTAKIDQD